VSKPDPFPYQKALEVKLPDAWRRAAAVFDETNVVSFAGLAPLLALAERAGLSTLIAERVRIDPAATKVKSAGTNPVGKLTSIIAGMAAGADCIDDLGVVRSGGARQLFVGVYAATTLGQFLREFTHGHTQQLASVLRAHLVNLVPIAGMLPGIDQRAMIDIDSLLRPVFGHGKQGASFGHTKIAGKQVLRRGLSPLVTTISTDSGAPVIAGIRLRAGKAGSGKGAASMIAEAIRTARAVGATGEILVRGDSAYGNAAVVTACLKAEVSFSVVLVNNPAVAGAIATIPEDAWTPVHYPGAVVDPGHGTADQRRRGRRDRIHRLRLYHDAGHRAAGRAPRPRPRQARGTVPGLAASPVPDQQHRAGGAGRHHPPEARHHRDRAVRRDRRPVGPPALEPVRLERRVGDLYGHHAQPAPRRRHPRRRSARRRPRRHTAPAPRRRPGTARATTAPRRPTPSSALALGRAMAAALDRYGRPTSSRLTHPPPPWRNQESEMLGRPANRGCPSKSPRSIQGIKINQPVSPRIEA